MAKYGMSMCVLGHAAEFRPYGIAVNALWPATVIQTAALQMIPGVLPEHCRTPAIIADAAALGSSSDARDTANSGNFYIDEQCSLLTASITSNPTRWSAGATDFSPIYPCDGTVIVSARRRF